jgi:uncharacterized protein (AIM24 family)
MDFDALVAWIDAHLGRRVFAATQTLDEEAGNTRLSVVGTLARQKEGDIQLIDPRPGRIEVLRVGDAVLVLLEGDFLSAESVDFGTGLPQIVEAGFRGAMSVTLGETA